MDHATDMTMGYSNGPIRSTALPGGHMTPHDFHPPISSKVAPLVAATVSTAWKNEGKYLSRCLGFTESRM